MTQDGTPYDEDERYRFKFFEADLLRALGRLTLNASYLESTVALILARMVDDDDLELGKRLAADATFRWLIDHVRAISEHLMPPDVHNQMVEWLRNAERAYAERNRIVHSDHAISIGTEEAVALLWVRTSSRGKNFVEDIIPATAEEVHEAARRLEEVGLEGLDVMTQVMEAVDSRHLHADGRQIVAPEEAAQLTFNELLDVYNSLRAELDEEYGALKRRAIWDRLLPITDELAPRQLPAI
ncbi:MAG: hypothetical protein M3423_10055 [Actinomycetota bacterium]|nr:hypothetical protein [Actinomycetota bacterium]